MITYYQPREPTTDELNLLTTVSYAVAELDQSTYSGDLEIALCISDMPDKKLLDGLIEVPGHPVVVFELRRHHRGLNDEAYHLVKQGVVAAAVLAEAVELDEACPHVPGCGVLARSVEAAVQKLIVEMRRECARWN